MLHALCGKIASGKSTLAAQLAEQTGGFIIAEDQWLATLYPGEIKTPGDFLARSCRLQVAMAPLITSALGQGMTVILDFHANTVVRRSWMRSLAETAGTECQLHWLDVPDALCKDRLRKRNQAGSHAYQTSEEEFDHIGRFFEVPRADEGWRLEHHRI